jgi:ankyrin repeat protein
MNFVYKIIFLLCMLTGSTSILYCMDIWEAVQANDGACVKEFVRQNRAVINGKDKNGYTPLHYAVLYGYEQMVEELIALGADVNAHDKRGKTLLYYAIIYKYQRILEILIAAKANVNIKNNFGRTPLHEAVFDGNGHMVKALLAAGADANIPDNYGRTPLYWASRDGYLEIAQTLIAYGADVNIQNACGDTPLHEAALVGEISIVQLLQDYLQRIEQAHKRTIHAMAAFAQGQHSRLGTASPVAFIDPYNIHFIGMLVAQQEQYDARHIQECHTPSIVVPDTKSCIVL